MKLVCTLPLTKYQTCLSFNFFSDNPLTVGSSCKQSCPVFAETPALGNMATAQPITSFFQPVKIKTVEEAEAMECDAK